MPLTDWGKCQLPMSCPLVLVICRSLVVLALCCNVEPDAVGKGNSHARPTSQPWRQGMLKAALPVCGPDMPLNRFAPLVRATPGMLPFQHISWNCRRPWPT